MTSMVDPANDNRHPALRVRELKKGELTKDEALVLMALGNLALISGPGDDVVQRRQKLRAYLKSKNFKREASEALGRVLARLIEGGSLAVPEDRQHLIDLLNGKTEFKVVLQRQRSGGPRGVRALAVEVASFVCLRTENGDKQESAIQAAMKAFGLGRRRIFDLMKEADALARRVQFDR